MCINYKQVCKMELLCCGILVSGERGMEAKYSSREEVSGWPWLWSTSAGSMETPSVAQEKASACNFLGFVNCFKIAVCLKLGKPPQGCTAVCHGWLCRLSSTVPYSWCQGLHCMGEHQGCDYPMLVLDGNHKKNQTVGAKLGTYSFKPC